MQNERFVSLVRRAMGNRVLRVFGTDAGINVGNLSRILRGQIKPLPPMIKKIAEAAYNGVTYEDLLIAAGYLESEKTVDEKKSHIPIYTANVPLFADADILGHIQMTYEMDGKPEDYFALKVKDDSMQAENMPKESIIIARKQNTGTSGEIVVAIADGKVTVRKYFIRKDHVILLPASFVPIYEPQMYDSANEVVLLGKVVKAIVDINIRPAISFLDSSPKR